MNITTRIFGIATLLIWIIIVFFFITAVYSVTNLDVNVGQVEMLPAGNGISFSLPFTINNNGYYELANLNLTTLIKDPKGNMLDQTETLIPSIPQGANINASHKITIDLDEILSMNHLILLLEDSEFLIELFASLDFAHVVPVQLSINSSIPWGAPFADFSVGEISISQIEENNVKLSIPLSFENHAILDLSGTLILELCESSEEMITFGTMVIDVPSQDNYVGNLSLEISYEDWLNLESDWKLHLIFETQLFRVDWWEPYD